MSGYVLMIISVIFCLISMKLISYKSGNHDADLVLKIIGFILFIPAIIIVLESFKIIEFIKWK